MLQDIALLAMFIFVLSDRLVDLTYLLLQTRFTSFQVLSKILGYIFMMKSYPLFLSVTKWSLILQEHKKWLKVQDIDIIKSF